MVYEVLAYICIYNIGIILFLKMDYISFTIISYITNNFLVWFVRVFVVRICQLLKKCSNLTSLRFIIR